jgi:hypothetical protein
MEGVARICHAEAARCARILLRCGSRGRPFSRDSQTIRCATASAFGWRGERREPRIALTLVIIMALGLLTRASLAVIVKHACSIVAVRCSADCIRIRLQHLGTRFHNLARGATIALIAVRREATMHERSWRRAQRRGLRR